VSILRRVRIHDLVRWPLIGTKTTGEPIWGPPEDVKCRWDESVREIIRPDNTRISSRIEIISEIKLKVGDIVRRGTIADTSDWIDPRNNQDAFEVVVSEQYDTLRGTETLFLAYA
jgi:hypothetical protein